jgi:hypothetical protein
MLCCPKAQRKEDIYTGQQQVLLQPTTGHCHAVRSIRNHINNDMLICRSQTQHAKSRLHNKETMHDQAHKLQTDICNNATSNTIHTRSHPDTNASPQAPTKLGSSIYQLSPLQRGTCGAHATAAIQLTVLTSILPYNHLADMQSAVQAEVGAQQNDFTRKQTPPVQLCCCRVPTL